MRDWLSKLIIICTCISLLGAHTAIVQIYAWSTMLKDRIPTQSLETALNTTFSGEHPCEICLKIAAQKETERREKAPTKKNDPQPKKIFSSLSILKHKTPSPLSVRTLYFRYNLYPENQYFINIDTPPPQRSIWFYNQKKQPPLPPITYIIAPIS